MPHKRAAIRDAVYAALDATPQLKGRVDKSRVRRTQDNELPVALIYSFQEQSQLATLGRTLSRRLSLVIEIRVAATNDLDDAIDALCSVVETAIGADSRFALIAIDSSLESTQIGLKGEADMRHGVALLTYAVTYRTEPGSPEV